MTQYSSTYTPRAVRPSHLRGPEPSWRSLFVRSGRPDTITVTTGIKGLCAHTHRSQAALPFGLKRRCECECARRMATPARCAWSSRYVRAYTSSWPTPLPEPGGQSRRRSGTGLFTHGHMQGVPGGLWLSLGIMATWHHAGGSAGFGHDTNLMRRTQPGGRGGGTCHSYLARTLSVRSCKQGTTSCQCDRHVGHALRCHGQRERRSTCTDPH